MPISQRQQSLSHIKVKVTYDLDRYAPTDAVPDYPTKRLLAWVGASELRAKRVLAHELARPHPRLKVIITLADMLGISTQE